MRGSTAALALVVSLFAATLVSPALAHAVPGVSVNGTVTVSGVATEGARVVLYQRDTHDGDWNGAGEVLSDAQGAFSFTAPEGEFFIRADAANSSLEAVSPRFTMAIGEETSTVLALVPETGKPRITLANRLALKAYYDDLFRGYSPDAYARGDVVFMLWAYDEHLVNDWYFDGSGIASVFYSINRGPYVETKQMPDSTRNGLDVAGLLTTDGITTLSYYAIDRNGNMSDVGSEVFYIDRVAPTADYDRRAATGRSIKLIGRDSGSGLASTFWRIGGVGAFRPGNVVPVPQTGVSTLEYYAVDKAGNMGDIKSLRIRSRAGLSVPRASATSARAGRSFSVSGAVWRRPGATGQLRVYKLIGGSYKLVAKKGFKESSTGRYRVSLKLDSGTYRFRTFYGANTATYSNPPVSSAYSARTWVR